MNWYYIQNGKQMGPVSEQELGTRLKNGELPADTLVWRDGIAEWKPASNQPEFGAYLGGSTGATSGSQPLNPYQSPQAAYPGAASATIPNYLWQSIVVTIMCCWPLGIPAIVFAAKVNSLVAQGNLLEAQDASNKAKTWCWVAFGCGLFAVLCYIALVAVAGFQRSSS